MSDSISPQNECLNTNKNFFFLFNYLIVNTQINWLKKKAHIYFTIRIKNIIK